MKTTALTLVVLMTVTGSAFAKPIPSSNAHPIKVAAKFTDVFGTFHVHRQGDFASLNWNVTSDAATSFLIERSYDNPATSDVQYFSDVATVSADARRWNRYTDNTVDPGVIYYRITAFDANGVCVGVSEIESVKIVKHK